MCKKLFGQGDLPTGPENLRRGISVRLRKCVGHLGEGSLAALLSTRVPPPGNFFLEFWHCGLINSAEFLQLKMLVPTFLDFLQGTGVCKKDEGQLSMCSMQRRFQMVLELKLEDILKETSPQHPTGAWHLGLCR